MSHSKSPHKLVFIHQDWHEEPIEGVYPDYAEAWSGRLTLYKNLIARGESGQYRDIKVIPATTKELVEWFAKFKPPVKENG